ncbi:MAG: IS21 family transposase [Desulfobulbaceae bacterium]|nr:IS21 family transposase [Desulfobulbaceae bacterium]
MLIVETIAKIRRYYFVEGRSIKKISKDLNISRNTVRKVIRSGKTRHEYSREKQPYPKLGGYLEFLEDYLQKDWMIPKKRRITARRLHELLYEQGYQGAYDSIQRYVRQWRHDKNKIKSGVFIPLYFPPGDAYQFDWSHETVVIAGEIRKIKAAHFRLSHSRKFFVRAYYRETQEMLLDAHNKAFECFDGTCKRGIYDNMSTAVTTILKGKEREYNQRFIQMCSHYLVKPVACTPGAGWEKGQIEKQVQDVRKWIFTPRLRFTSLEELNEWLSDRCHEICRTRQHPIYKNKTIQEVFEEEQKLLIPVKKPFEGYIDKECTVSSTSLIRYDRNHYSVPCKSAGKTATVRAKADQIIIIKNGKQIASHARNFERGKTVYNPWHYLDVLQRKPGALRNGAPFQDWNLPSGIKRVQAHLTPLPGGDRKFVDILFAARLHGVKLTNKACLKALSQGVFQSEVILNILARELDGPKIRPVNPPVCLQLKQEPLADCSRYDHLRKGGAVCSATN